MRLRTFTSANAGYSLLELLLVLVILGICLGSGMVHAANGLRVDEARGAAQAWQTAAGWAQIGVVWHGGTTELGYEAGTLALNHDFGLCGGDLGSSAPAVPVSANLARWRTPAGARVSFGSLGAPDGGGSVYFQAWQRMYRVIVRPESGLTVRSLVP
jgi:prepilin-type N-terminal cleavage/methylation domain-containing protein